MIDEADTLFDQSFESAITSILKEVKVALDTFAVTEQAVIPWEEVGD